MSRFSDFQPRHPDRRPRGVRGEKEKIKRIMGIGEDATFYPIIIPNKIALAITQIL